MDAPGGGRVGYGKSAYLVARTLAGASCGAWTAGISWKWGSGRRPGGLASLVQQHDVAARVRAAAARVVRMRIMVIRMGFWDQSARISAVLGARLVDCGIVRKARIFELCELFFAPGIVKTGHWC